jgi:hypothetical protein
MLLLHCLPYQKEAKIYCAHAVLLLLLLSSSSSLLLLLLLLRIANARIISHMIYVQTIGPPWFAVG